MFKAGFRNWKKAVEGYSIKNRCLATEDPKKVKGFPKHERKKSHQEAVVRYEKVCASHAGTIPDLTSDAMADERKTNRNALLKILSNIRYLGKNHFYLHFR